VKRLSFSSLLFSIGYCILSGKFGFAGRYECPLRTHNISHIICLRPCINRGNFAVGDFIKLYSQHLPISLQVAYPFQRTSLNRGSAVAYDVEQSFHLAEQHHWPGVLIFAGLMQGLDDLVIPLKDFFDG